MTSSSATDLRGVIAPFEELRQEPGADNAVPGANNAPAVKYGLELAGHYGGPVRPPIVDLSTEGEPRARKRFRHIADADVFPGPG